MITDKLDKEIWKKVVGYEGYYEVSNHGRFRSVDRFVKGRWGKVLRKGKMISLTTDTRGYHAVKVSKNGKRRRVSLHRFVAEAFIPNPNNKPAVNHIDGNKKNNHVSNLEWVTFSENSKHAIETGLFVGKRGEQSHYAKLNAKQVRKIRLLYATGNYSYPQIAEIFNISQANVGLIVNKKTWTEVERDDYTNTR